jgi:flagellar hook assembly protein FlgD
MLAFDLSDVRGTRNWDNTVAKTNHTTDNTNTSSAPAVRSRKVKISEGTTRLWRSNDWDTIVELRKQVLKQAKKHGCDVDIVDCNGKVIYTAHPKDEE